MNLGYEFARKNKGTSHPKGKGSQVIVTAKKKGVPTSKKNLKNEGNQPNWIDLLHTPAMFKTPNSKPNSYLHKEDEESNFWGNEMPSTPKPHIISAVNSNMEKQVVFKKHTYNINKNSNLKVFKAHFDKEIKQLGPINEVSRKKEVQELKRNSHYGHIPFG